MRHANVSKWARNALAMQKRKRLSGQSGDKSSQQEIAQQLEIGRKLLAKIDTVGQGGGDSDEENGSGSGSDR